MPLILSETSGKDFIPAPAGTHRAVCVDVVDLGMVEVTYMGETKKQRKVRVAWEIEELMEDGRPFIVTNRYTASLHEKSRLRHDLEAWRGRPFTEEELKGFDLEKLLGANALISVIHKPGNDGKVWPNVASISPPMRGMAHVHPSGAYVRVKDRNPEPVEPARNPGEEPPSGEAADIQDDDSLPF